MPSALPASSAAPAEAASPERWRSAGMPEDGRQDLDPHRQPGAGAAERHPRRGGAAQAPDRHHLHHPQHVPGHRLHHGPGQVAGAVGRAQPHEPGPGVVAPPRGAGAVEPGHGDHPRARRAGSPPPGAPARRGCGRAAAPARPGRSRRPTGRPRAASPRRRPGSPRRRPATGTGPLVHRHRHVGRGAPADHRVVLRRARPQHLALAVAGADDHRDAGPQTELGAPAPT